MICIKYTNHAIHKYNLNMLIKLICMVRMDKVDPYNSWINWLIQIKLTRIMCMSWSTWFIWHPNSYVQEFYACEYNFLFFLYWNFMISIIYFLESNFRIILFGVHKIYLFRIILGHFYFNIFLKNNFNCLH